VQIKCNSILKSWGYLCAFSHQQRKVNSRQSSLLLPGYSRRRNLSQPLLVNSATFPSLHYIVLVTDVSDSTRMRSPASPGATAAARQAADDDAEQRDNGVDDGLETGGNGVDNRHDAVADGAENRLDLLCLLVQARLKNTQDVKEGTYAGYNSAHYCGCVVCSLMCVVVSDVVVWESRW
jgi:hypothetical protein